MRSIIAVLVAVPFFVSLPAVARSRASYSKSSSKKSGPTCKKGKPCGNSCIAKDKVCHQAPGTAKAADEIPADKEKSR